MESGNVETVKRAVEIDAGIASVSRRTLPGRLEKQEVNLPLAAGNRRLFQMRGIERL
jgi:hypothetical protein